ncbi:MAG: hypothetical protein IPK22_11060 [Verrucomicrobiaceae bacterium]|nr:hypothetical protein [Verrucomicrobiaceae bacterium]
MSSTLKNCPACGQPLTHAKMLFHRASSTAYPPAFAVISTAPTLEHRRAAYRAILNHPQTHVRKFAALCPARAAPRNLET